MRHDHRTGLEANAWTAHNQGVGGFYDTNLSDLPQHETPADLCLYGLPGRKCGCGFCREMVQREREGGERI